MSYYYNPIKVIYILVLIGSLYSCADSDPVKVVLPGIISSVAIPYIKDSTLYEFIPAANAEEESRSKELASSNKNLMVALDTDRALSSTDINNNDYYARTELPEHVVYVRDQSLYLFDLANSRKHKLFTSENIICDLKKVTEADIDALLERQIFYTDSMSVYIKTSSQNSCDVDLEFLQIDINSNLTVIAEQVDDGQGNLEFESIETTENYELRRTELISHIHVSTHEHTHIEGTSADPDDHDDHDHPEGEEDTFHSHDHKHTHGFNYSFLPEHNYLSREAIEKVHNDPKNQETLIEEHPILIGHKSNVSEALMYSGKPIIDTDNKQFGYMGFETRTSEDRLECEGSDDSAIQLVFFLGDLENSIKRRLWCMQHDGFDTRPSIEQSNQDLNTLLSALSNRDNFRIFDSLILLEFDWNLVGLELDHIFDDDRNTEREASFTNPILKRSMTEEYTGIRILSLQEDLLIVEDSGLSYQLDIDSSTIETVDLSLSPPSTPPIRDFSNNNLSDIAYKLTTGKLLSAKSFSGTDPVEQSLTSTEISSGVETSLIERSTRLLELIMTDNNKLLVTTSNNEPVDVSSYVFTGNASQIFSNSRLAQLQDLRQVTPSGIVIANTEVPAILHSIEVDSNENNLNYLRSPSMYFFDQSEHIGLGDILGELPVNVASVESLVIINQYYGFIEFKTATTLDSHSSAYFFSPSRSYLNPDGESNEMKLMFSREAE